MKFVTPLVKQLPLSPDLSSILCFFGARQGKLEICNRAWASVYLIHFGRPAWARAVVRYQSSMQNRLELSAGSLVRVIATVCTDDANIYAASERLFSTASSDIKSTESVIGMLCFF